MLRNPRAHFRHMLDENDGFEIDKFLVKDNKIYAIVEGRSYQVDDLVVSECEEEGKYYYCIKTDHDFFYDYDSDISDEILTDSLNDYFKTFPDEATDYYEVIIEVMEDEYVAGYADAYDGYENTWY